MATQRGTRSAIAIALAASGIVLTPGIQNAKADSDTDGVATPTLEKLRQEGSDLFLTFTDHSSHETGFVVTVRGRDDPNLIVSKDLKSPGAIPGNGRQATRQVSGISSTIPVCATIQAYDDSGLKLPGFQAPTYSAESNTVCTDPATAAASSDLAVEGVNGPQERSFATFGNRDLAYGVDFRNTGGADATGVVVDVSTSDVATLGDQAASPFGFFTGFTCATRPPSGGETAAMRCTGDLKQGQKANAAVIVRFTGTGFGTIHASVSGAGDTNGGNNGGALTVHVT
jgi:hypothetical protein